MKRTLVLLHGAASNSTRWSEFVERTRLKDGWSLLHPDLRGNGAAAWPRTRLGMGVWCADIAALLEGRRCARAVIAGHCLGANIALQFAARYPARAAALILIEPTAPQALAGTMRWLSLLTPLLYAVYFAGRALNSIGVYRRRLESLDLREWDRATRRGDVALSLFGSVATDLRCTPVAAYARMYAATAERWPDLRQIRVPVLVLLSRRSSFTDPARTREALSPLPECEIAEFDAVHWIPTEQPDAMRTTIEDWLTKRGPETAP